MTLPPGSQRWPINHPPGFADVALNVTYACDLACVGCNRGGFVKPAHTPPMTPARLAEFLDEAKETGIAITRLRIVGCEPTLHPDFLELVRISCVYAKHAPHKCKVRVYSNFHSKHAKLLTIQAARRHPGIRLMRAGAKTDSVTFPPLTRYIYVNPADAGIHCPHPCPIMGGRGICGYGVDQLGYYLCPTAGTIDSLLGLGTRAKTLKEMLDPDFVRRQAATVCSACGNYIAFGKNLPKTWDWNGTPVSQSYHERMQGCAR